jgi:[protein-PII] uridylyltransferase
MVAGSAGLVEQVWARTRELLRETDFVGALRASRVEREIRSGDLAGSQSPDLRDGLGGLRDVDLILWLGLRGAVDAPPPSGDMKAAGDFLWRVRIALHRVAGPTSNVLSPEHDEAVASELGVVDGPRWSAADALVRDVHRAGAFLGLMAEAELDRAGQPSAPRRPAPGASSEEWPAPFVRLAEHGQHLASMSSVALGVPPEGATWSPEAMASFVRILASGEGGARALRAMAALGVLQKVLPEWRDVEGRPQRDPYHQHPVDVHLVEAAAQAAKLMHRPGEAFASEAVVQLSDPAPLLLGAFLHDIGKVGRGSHVRAGVEVAGAVLERMGADAATRDTVLFLVHEHLLLSDTATRRDLDDRDLITDVAARVGTPERLAMLYLLTVADALATGPSASTAWRMGLVRDLVSKVSQVLEGDVARPGRPDGPVAASGLRLQLASPRPGATEVRTHVRAARTPGTFALTVVALDRPGLLARIAGALTLSGLSILSAQAFTTGDGIAVDAFEVGPAFDEEVGEERWRRFRTTLRHAIEGRIDVRDRIERLREHYRPARTGIPISVRIDQGASSSFSVVEVGAADRLGLLFDLARTFSAQGLDVHLAKVATYGPRVVDVFYVTDAAGSKVSDAGREADLERALADAAG